MKQTFLLISLFILLIGNPVIAVTPKYSLHTSLKDVEFKKKKALQWYQDNVDNKKFYGYDAQKHIASLKNRALKWYENNITKGKFYFVHPEHELAFTKKKALRWHDRNSH